GDNTQPWRFEVIEQNHFLIHAHDTRDWCVYDLDGRASQTAVGALLETIAIAATTEGMSVEFTRREDAPETNPVIDAVLSEMPGQKPHPLAPFIRARVTQRRAFSTRPLTATQKEMLEESVGPDYHIVWIEGWGQKWQMAKLLFHNAKIRLTIPEAYEVHKRIIQWDAQFSEDRIPDQAVGLDPVALKLMRWAMQSWERVKLLNRYFAGTMMPRIQLDLIPGLRCAAHFVIVANKSLEDIDNYLDGGRTLQRFWLTATRIGLQFQPEMTPLIFSRYVSVSENFTGDRDAIREANLLAFRLRSIVGEKEIANAVFMGRMGIGGVPASRSVRKPFVDLLAQSD
ncbi:MAG: hypothetical protein GY934_06470, partial [Gammaproteobacteria bacterium]|nr:hypothetical protein [Gammaproteobacteria bacterium]